MSEIRVNNIIDEAGTGAPTLPNGVTIQGNTTGTNLTLSGDLTVNGTTTTIDTAVTSVDSLQVDGNVAIGTDTTYTNNSFTTLSVGGNTKFGLLELKKSDGVAGSWIDCYGDGGNGDLRITTAGTNGNISFLTGGTFTEKLRITSGGTLFSYSTDDTTPNFKWRSDDTNWHGALNISVEGSSIASFWSTGGDWSVNGTTYSCTKNVAAYPSSAIAVHNQYNNSFESKFVFLKKAGGSTTTDGGVTELASISSAGVISDSIGPLRRLGIQGASGSFALAGEHAGKLVRSTGNGNSITIPQNVFSAGDMISVFNVSTGDNTIAQGTGVTLYNTADGATGNRTLGAKGVCTIVCTSTNEFIISGSQVS